MHRPPRCPWGCLSQPSPRVLGDEGTFVTISPAWPPETPPSSAAPEVQHLLHLGHSHPTPSFSVKGVKALLAPFQCAEAAAETSSPLWLRRHTEPCGCPCLPPE